MAEPKGWAGTRDIDLYARAAEEGFHAILTNDTKQLSRPMEVVATAESGLHRIEYRQNHKHGGLVGLGAAIATVCAGLPPTRWRNSTRLSVSGSSHSTALTRLSKAGCGLWTRLLLRRSSGPPPLRDDEAAGAHRSLTLITAQWSA